jgi:serine/threonine protein kinase
MEWGGPLGDLYQYTRHQKVPEPIVVIWSAQILSALNHIHSHHIILRDLKPENIIITEHGDVKITDFGLALIHKTKTDFKTTSHFCGTSAFVPPEVLKQTPDSLSHLIDYWCLGIMMYEWLFGCLPFYHINKQIMYQKIINQPLLFPPHHQVSNQMLHLITGLLQKIPYLRFQFSNCQKHPVFKNVPWCDINKGIWHMNKDLWHQYTSTHKPKQNQNQYITKKNQNQSTTKENHFYVHGFSSSSLDIFSLVGF